MNILLIDLSSIAHPLFHVSASDPDPNATSIKTVERVRALASGQPHVAVCVEGGKSFRKDLDPQYKANRPEHDAALQHQIKLAIETLKADGYPVWSAPGYEADDIIGSATREAIDNSASSDDVHVTIASADKDLTQLIGPRVSVHRLADGSLWDAETVKAKLGVAPDQVVDFLALCGDASDNIKGANGIGPKKAGELLRKYGNLEDLYADLTAHGTHFTRGCSTALREFHPRMALTRELIRLKTDAPINFDEIFKPRVPADTEVFGDDIEEWMPTLSEDATKAEAVVSQAAVTGNRPVEQAPGAATARPTPAAVASLPVPGTLIKGPDTCTAGQQMPPQAAQEAPGPTIPPFGPEHLPRPTRASEAVLVPAGVPYERQLEPTTLRECYVLAGEMFKSRLFSAYGTPQGVLSTILAGRELGLSAMASLRNFHIIDGKPSLSADLIRALVLQSGKAESFRCSARSPDAVTFVTIRKGDPEFALTYTIDEAKSAWSKGEPAWKASGWGRHPADMLVARCSAKLARLIYADVVTGLYSPEEFE